MLVTPQIDKDLFEGKCVFRTINQGLTSTATIPVPKGGYIILRQIIFYPPAVGVANPETRPIIQLSMVENGSKDEILYIFRTNTTLNYDPTNNRKWHTGGNPQQIETFKVFKKFVQIDLSITANFAGITYPLPDGFVSQAEERNPPLGYGTAPVSAIDSQATLPTGETFYPTGQTREFSAIPFNGSDRLRFPFDNTVQIPQINGQPDSGFQPALFTFGYFEYTTPIKNLK
jgi:hypothetical protein